MKVSVQTKDDISRMGERERLYSRREIVHVLLAALLISAIWLLNAVITRPGIEHIGAMSDHVNIQLYLQKAENPNLYPKDYLFSGTEVVKHYTPSYRWMINFLTYFAGNYGNALVILVPMISFVYIVSMTLFIRLFTPNLLLAILLAAVSTVPHFAPGNTFWGTGGIYSTFPRSVFTAVAPLLMIIHLRFSSNIRGAGLSLGAVGLAANLHPVSGAILAQVLMVERGFAVARRKFPLKGIFLSAAAFFIGALPFMIGFFSLSREKSTSGTDINPVDFYEAILLRFNGNLLPLNSDVLWRFSEAFIPLAIFIFAGVFYSRLNIDKNHNTVNILRILAALIIAVIGGQIILQLLARKVGWSFMVIDQLRGIRFVYPIAFALAATGLESIRTRVPKLLRIPSALAVALFILPVISLPSFALTRMYLPKPASSGYLLLSGRADQIRQEFQIQEPNPKTIALEEAARWARENTAHDSLFLCDDGRFRLYSKRSVTFAFKDGGSCYYLGKAKFMEWARREALLRKARNSESLETVNSLGEKLGCDFALVDKTIFKIISIDEAVFQNDYFALVKITKNSRI